MESKIFIATPPFTQLNTPYPATAYIKGFLNTINVNSVQADLGIEVILALFSKVGLTDLFNFIASNDNQLSPNSERIFYLKEDYIKTIHAVIS